ncbi:BadM/Rrf2 family transcriptional regulator [Novosphingobium nitrogenifigens DSM 19370]|uniref:BadM/Rrf2 family transcriptional regulator n=1 Tax=Novosphingobium nitrogenifigens DSM 19370 TaxID=983920 RepID=F1Z6R0_9SPHN|nr:SUF system Fe-S cluster assembly regulator [Novosphingobium nitrogenifigens]EGD59720.1 BadM/Rrf2 family transcriptional regulator [Novosphingobium nitrogenifigens DSM 19370]
MRLSSMADYAVVAMSAAARRCGHARVSAQQLAEDTGLPVPTVQKLVSKLSAAGLLRSVRGAGGGLTLARPAAAISLADIVEAVEGPIAMAQCSDNSRHDCTIGQGCQVRPHWPAVDAALRHALAGVSLSQLAAPGTQAAPALTVPGHAVADLSSDIPPAVEVEV